MKTKAMNAERRLAITFSITVFILVAEVAGGIISNSLALLSDAGHVLTDAFALGLSLLAARISRRPLDRKATYGYYRVGLLAAVVNGLSLLGIAAFIFYESYGRFVSPPEIDLAVMLPVAVGGFLANLGMAAILGHGHQDLNIKSAWLHVLGDTLSSLGVIVAGIVIHFTGWRYADPVAGLLIGAIIITGGVRVIKEAVHIFLDLVPKGYDVKEIVDELSKTEGVMSVHDVHLRSLSHGRVSFAAHVWVRDRLLSEVEGIRLTMEDRLAEMGISHVLLQFECVECSNDGLYCRTCSIRPSEMRAHGHEGHDH
jgi:cobalt-zinc-cadmium efflux system protein